MSDQTKTNIKKKENTYRWTVHLKVENGGWGEYHTAGYQPIAYSLPKTLFNALLFYPKSVNMTFVA